MYNFAWMLQSAVTHKDADDAADLILKALGRHSEKARQRLSPTFSSWSPEFRRALQTRLRDGCHYTGQVDGESREPSNCGDQHVFQSQPLIVPNVSICIA
jgi:hypothetical protein